MAQKGVTFRRIGGRIVPIRASAVLNAGGAAFRTARAGAAAHSIRKSQTSTVAPNKFMAAAAISSGILSGVLSGATFYSKGKTFAIGQGASLGLDFAGAGLSASSYAGKGKLKQRAIGAAKLEAINQVTGYAALGATLLAQKKTRQHILNFGSKVLGFVKNRAPALWKAAI